MENYLNVKGLDMTDLEKFIELYASIGIKLIVCDCVLSNEESLVVTLHQGSGHPVLEECTFSDKFDGYVGFFSSIIFNKEGKFIKQTFSE